MPYKARIKNNICTNAHPVGCFYHVHEQIQQMADVNIDGGENKTALVVGASSGIGLASRIALTFAAGMDTLGVYCDRAAQAHKIGSAGWYNNQAFEYYARRANKMALSSNQDAFQRNAKDWVIQKLQQQEKKLDVLIYSLAAPKRSIKGVGEFRSAIKPITGEFNGQTVDPFKHELRALNIEAASQDEVEATVKVMGGEDWQDWVNQLKQAGVLAPNFKTIAYSYLGPDHTQEIYGDGTLGAAKSHLHETAIALDQNLQDINGQANIGLFQALVTPSSSVIPSMPLYISVLHQLQKEMGTYESTVQQVSRLFKDGFLINDTKPDIKLRADQFERDPKLQEKLNDILTSVTQDNLDSLVDLDGFVQSFLQQFGFGYDFIDYDPKPDPLTPPALHDFNQSSDLKKAG